MKLSTPFFLFAVFISTICFPAQGQPYHDIGFDYSGPRGPANWGDLRPEWAACSTGTSQSPIDLVDPHLDSGLSGLLTNYTSNDAAIKNRVKDIAVEWGEGGGGTLLFQNVLYTLLEVHWHIHSEHAINGQRSHLEMHMVHQCPSGGLLVVGVLFNKTLLGSDPFLASLQGQLALLGTNATKHIPLGPKQPPSVSCLIKYYLYPGSLTTPPCSETVTWVVLHEVRDVNAVEFFTLRNALYPAYRKNARPLQPLHGRKISKWDH